MMNLFYYLIRVPGGISSRKVASSKTSSAPAASGIPCDSTPMIFAGCRFATSTIRFHMSTSGAYFVPMPATTCRSSEPSVTRSLSSFLEPRTFRYLNLQPLLKRVFSSNQIFNFSGYGKPASSFLRAFLAQIPASNNHLFG